MAFAFTRANHITTCGGQVTNSIITNSSVDMNGNIITNHGTPINDTDVVNKAYVDNNGIPNILINLLGTSYTTILSYLEGNIQITVKNLISGGPSASFNISKSEQTRYMHYIRLTSSAGINTEEKLEIRWNLNSNIELRKTGNNYDGQYRIKYIVN